MARQRQVAEARYQELELEPSEDSRDTSNITECDEPYL